MYIVTIFIKEKKNTCTCTPVFRLFIQFLVQFMTAVERIKTSESLEIFGISRKLHVCNKVFEQFNHLLILVIIFGILAFCTFELHSLFWLSVR